MTYFVKILETLEAVYFIKWYSTLTRVLFAALIGFGARVSLGVCPSFSQTKKMRCAKQNRK